MLGTNLIKLELSTHQIVFTPGNAKNGARASRASAPDLAVTVTNTSQKFASFQLSLHADGQVSNDTVQWYEIKPNASAKKPPGDRTTFYITLLKAPVLSYDTTLPLTLKLFSAELADLEASESLYLKILRPDDSLRLELPVSTLNVHPGSRLHIPILVHNLEPFAREIFLQLSSSAIALEWFPKGTQQSLQIESGSSATTEFWCSPHTNPHSLRGIYPITVEASDLNGNIVSADTEIEVLPFGQTQVDVIAPEQTLPIYSPGVENERPTTAFFQWSFDNQSNLQQHIFLRTHENEVDTAEDFTANELTLDPDTQGELTLAVENRRPWLGWVRTRFIEIFPDIRQPDSGEPIPEVTVHPASQLLTVKVRPIVPWWVQILLGLFGFLSLAGALWLLLRLPRAIHQASVNSTVLMASGNTVVSGGRDGKVYWWQGRQAGWLPNVRRLHYLHAIETDDNPIEKAVRVIEPMPDRGKQIAIGLESGEIQLWKLDPPQQLGSFIEEIDSNLFEETELEFIGETTPERIEDDEPARFFAPDRVFDLAFTQDSRHLFSGHSSGIVRRWDVATQKSNHELYIGGGEKKLSAVITAIDVIEQVGKPDLVVIAAQYNRLVLWEVLPNGENGIRAKEGTPTKAYDILYESAQSQNIPPVVSKNSYLTSLDLDDSHNLMVTADSTGLITVWNVSRLRDCITNSDEGQSTSVADSGNPFPLIECSDDKLAQWRASQQGSAIRDVSLTDDGRYLASTGDDGRISLWCLPEQFDTSSSKQIADERISIDTFAGELLNSVDIHLTTNNVVLLAADTTRHRVQFYRKNLGNHGCQ